MRFEKQDPQVSAFFAPLDTGHSRGELHLEDARQEIECYRRTLGVLLQVRGHLAGVGSSPSFGEAPPLCLVKAGSSSTHAETPQSNANSWREPI